MIKMFPRYDDVENWQVLETRTIHAYNTDETPIDVVKVQIGSLERCDVGLGWHFSTLTYPIIRWITKAEYDRLVKQEDTIIW